MKLKEGMLFLYRRKHRWFVEKIIGRKCILYSSDKDGRQVGKRIERSVEIIESFVTISDKCLHKELEDSEINIMEVL